MSLKAIKRKRAFTLVELLIVVIIIAVLAAIAIPKFTNSSLRSKEAALRAELKLLRDGVELFKNDTTCYPAAIGDLALTSAPVNCLNSAGTQISIPTGSWKGPYVSNVDNDPVSGNAFNYATTGVNIGKYTSSASGNDSNNVAYSTY